MTIITISRGSYSSGKEIAEKVAAKLGYECVGRDALIDASNQFNIPEIKLIKAIHDAPSILERFTHGKEKYTSYIQAALLRKVQKDNVVYHGLAGHFFLKNISHVLKVRIIANFETRVINEMEREHVSREEAYRLLKKDDQERVKWSYSLYGIDTMDPNLYDLVIHIKTLTVEDAVNMICNAVALDHLKTTAESQRNLDNIVIAASVKAELVQLVPLADVTCSDGNVIVHLKIRENWNKKTIDEIIKTAKSVDGVKTVHVDQDTTGKVSARTTKLADKYYLSSLDSENFFSTRECVFINRLHYNSGKECVLVRISPPLPGKNYGCDDIEELILTNRHEGENFSPIKIFPCFVYISRPLINDISQRTEITKKDVEIIGMGELYKTKFEADNHLFHQLRK